MPGTDAGSERAYVRNEDRNESGGQANDRTAAMGEASADQNRRVGETIGNLVVELAHRRRLSALNGDHSIQKIRNQSQLD
uniref:Uncharacterized protein n=1 Tax=uncultured myxobacterium HF0200_08J13 TaxID=723558 RepID=E7C3N8_9BACT|nr:hypothetical protein [uncultured myxobacterium HF0200_08J13]